MNRKNAGTYHNWHFDCILYDDLDQLPVFSWDAPEFLILFGIPMLALLFL